MKASIRWFRLLILSVPLCTLAPSAGAQWFAGVGDLAGGSFDSLAADVSNDGRAIVAVTGQVILPPPLPELPPLVFNDSRTAIWKANTGLQLLPEELDGVRGISADGTVVMGIRVDGDPGTPVYLWTEAGGLFDTGVIDLPWALSDDGTTVVGRGNVDGVTLAYRWNVDDGYESLGALPATNPRSEAFGVSADGSRVAIKSSNILGAPGFVWKEDDDLVVMDPVPVTRTVAGISGDGNTVFGLSDGASYLWTESGGYVFLGNTFNAGIAKIVRDADHHATLVVGGNFATEFSAAFIWDATNGMRELKAVLEGDYGLDLTGWTLTEARGISPNGLYISGEGINPEGNDEGWVAYLGTPTSCGLGVELALLLPALALARRRRR